MAQNRDKKGRTTERFRRSSARAAPTSVAALLEGVIGSPIVREKIREYAAFPHWEEIVGAEIAEVAVPEKIVRGRVLYVRVVDAVWAQELSLMKSQLLEKLRGHGAGAVLEDVRFVIGNPKAFAARKASAGN